jgi:prephenate dehydrogenase
MPVRLRFDDVREAGVARITIIGTGYIGTSIGLALKARKGNLEVVGHDRDFGRAGEARKLGAVDKAEWNLPAALEGAAMVVVATPLAAMEKLVEQMAPHLAPNAVVTDTASLKGPVLAWAARSLTGHAHFVGGHPIVGKPDDEAKPSATLFQDRTYCLIPARDAANEAVEQVIRLAQALGGVPMFLDPTEHDSHMAVVGQLPMLLASTLMTLAANNPSWRDGRRLAGPSFGAATALALTNPDEQVAQLRANRETLVSWIQALQSQLTELSQQLQDESPAALRQVLDAAQDQRARWRPGLGPEAEIASPEIPKAREQFSSWFLGRLGSRGTPGRPEDPSSNGKPWR